MISYEIIPRDIERLRRSLLDVLNTSRMESKLLPQRNATDLKQLLIRNILTQKYALGYAPYSPRYAAWKTQTMLMGSHFWRLYGDLLKNITAQCKGKAWFAGIPAGILDSGGKSWFSTRQSRVGKRKYIGMYARVMEFGYANHPARSVFIPTQEEYIKAGWINRGGESLKKVGNRWGR